MARWTIAPQAANVRLRQVRVRLGRNLYDSKVAQGATLCHRHHRPSRPLASQIFHARIAKSWHDSPPFSAHRSQIHHSVRKFYKQGTASSPARHGVFHCSSDQVGPARVASASPFRRFSTSAPRLQLPDADQDGVCSTASESADMVQLWTDGVRCEPYGSCTQLRYNRYHSSHHAGLLSLRRQLCHEHHRRR